MIEDPITLVLEKAVAGSAMRHQAILNNIANINTPNYKREDVNFKEQLSSVLSNPNTNNNSKLTDKIKNIKPDIITESDTSIRNDGNNVDVDKEMSILAKNSMEYEYYLSLLTKRLSIIKSVVNEGRR